MRSHYQHRLVLVGAESTGKTTLAEALAKRSKSVEIPEYGRDYDAVFRHGLDWSASDFEQIMEGHSALSDTMAQRIGPIPIEDTDAIQTLVWAEALLGKIQDSLVDRARQAVAGKTYLLLDHSVPWLDDGTRHFVDPARRTWFTSRLSTWLDEFGADWHLIGGTDWAKRTMAATAQLNALWATRVRTKNGIDPHSARVLGTVASESRAPG